MPQERLAAANIAGIELYRKIISTQYGRIVERSWETLDDYQYVRLDEIREARPRLLFIGTAHNVLIYLSGYIETLEEAR